MRTILISLILLSFLSPVTAQAQPWSEGTERPQGDHTWVELTSGEWLKGHITALYDSVLYFDSDHFGNLRIRVSKIRRVYGHGSFEVTLTDRSPLDGYVEIIDDKVFVVVAGQRHEYGMADLIAITPSAENEFDRWSGDVSAGVNVRRGNTDIAEANLAIGLVRRTPVSRVIIDYLGQVNETEGERVADSHRANVSVDRFTGGRFFWRPVSAQYFHDRFQNIQHQATVDTGVGYQVVDSPRVEWEVQAGAGVNYLRSVSVSAGESNDETSPVGTLGSDLTIEVTPSIDYELFIDMNFLNEESGRYQHHIVTSLSTDIFGNLDFDASLIWDRIENPQRQEDGVLPEKDDVRMIFGLSYEF